MKWLACLMVLTGCNARWASMTGEWFEQTPCEIGRFADVAARGRFLSAGAARIKMYSVWPGAELWVTPLRVEVERDLRGRLEPGVWDMEVSAPMRGNTLLTRHPSPVGTGGGGWFQATRVEGVWMLSLDGLTTGPENGPWMTSFGTFENEAAFEAAQLAGIQECPRTNLFGDAGL